MAGYVQTCIDRTTNEKWFGYFMVDELERGIARQVGDIFR